IVARNTLWQPAQLLDINPLIHHLFAQITVERIGKSFAHFFVVEGWLGVVHAQVVRAGGFVLNKLLAHLGISLDQVKLIRGKSADAQMSKQLIQYKAACTNYLGMNNAKP